MKNIFFASSVFLSLFFGAFIFASLPSTVSAQNSAPIFETTKIKLKDSSLKAGLGDPASTDGASVVSGIVRTVIGILGVVAVILVIYAGGLWLTAAGSEDKVTKAKKILRSTVVGIVIVGLAYAITQFIIEIAT